MGTQQASSRLDEEEMKLQDLDKAGHDLIWNRLAGRDESNPEHMALFIFCKKCERTWPWCNRRANIPRSVCRPSKSSAPAPEWVKNLDKTDTMTTESQSQPNPIDVVTTESSQQPLRRIRGKTRLDTPRDTSIFAEPTHV